MTDAWDAAAAARELFNRFEPLHAVVYFDPGLTAHGEAVGLKGYWMAYFATRVAPLGELGPEATTAVFYNWHPRRVGRSLPDAWAMSSRAQVLQARLAAAEDTLGKAFAGLPASAVEEAAELLWAASQEIDAPGRPLGAANQALPRPATPVSLLWQAATTLREHRGDGHNAVLLARGVGPAEAHFIKSGAGEWDGQQLKTTRQYEDDEWAATAARMVRQGLLDEAGRLTEAGGALHREIEGATDRAASAPWEALGPEATEATLQAVRPLARAVIGLGILPGTAKAQQG